MIFFVYIMLSYVDQLLGEGVETFVVNDIAKTFGISNKAAYLRCYRLEKEGVLCQPIRGFYIIIPPEHRPLGSLPEKELVILIMQKLQLPYYAGLLSAALLHGASHQRPMTFQIITSKQLKSITMGQVKIEFLYKKALENLPIENYQTKNGNLKMSSPELTVMDFFLYQKKAGGVNHIATLVSELLEVLDVKKLISLYEFNSNKLWLQRLGFILESIDPFEEERQDIIVLELKEYIKKQKLRYTPLVPGISTQNCEKNKTWKILINSTVEADI